MKLKSRQSFRRHENSELSLCCCCGASERERSSDAGRTPQQAQCLSCTQPQGQTNCCVNIKDGVSMPHDRCLSLECTHCRALQVSRFVGPPLNCTRYHSTRINFFDPRLSLAIDFKLIRSAGRLNLHNVEV